MYLMQFPFINVPDPFHLHVTAKIEGKTVFVSYCILGKSRVVGTLYLLVDLVVGLTPGSRTGL